MKKTRLFAIVISLMMMVTATIAPQTAITALAASKPAQVTSVKLKQISCSKIKISYKKVKGATGYAIYYSSSKNGKYKLVKTAKKNSCTYKVKNTKKGYYKVKAYKVVNKKKVYGKFSAVKSIKTAHKYNAYILSKDPTCTEKGSKYKKCKYCGKKVTASVDIDTIDGHSYVVSPATCDTDGKKYCEHCGKVIASYVDKATGHSYTRSEITTAPTCTAEGVKTYYCDKCSSTKTEPVAIIAHSFDNGVITKTPTCKDAGEQTFTCTVCGLKDVKPIPATNNHSFTGKVESNNDKTHKVYCKTEGCDGYEVKDCSFSTPVVIKAPTLEENGVAETTCQACGYSYTMEVVLNCTHTDADKTVVNASAPTCLTGGYTGDIFCNVDNAIVEYGSVIAPLGHDHQEQAVGFCLTAGYTNMVCSRCGDSYIDESKPVAPLGHDYSIKTIEEHGYIVSSCSRCEQTKTDTTCYIDITNKTVSVPAVAEFKVTATTGRDVLELNPDGVSDYEITGEAANLTIEINATVDCDVKLAGVSITNNTLANGAIGDCIDVKNKSADVNVVPTVSISAKDGTVNTLKALATGANAIQNTAKLELKGHGTLNIDTVSTALDARAKVLIRNLTLNITSKNRGIDTKIETKNDAGTVISTEYANIEFGANATVTVNTTDDGIRCKNMDFAPLGEGDTDSVVSITSTAGDAIQLEGGASTREASLIMESGTLNLKDSKSYINNKSGKPPVKRNTAQINFL